MTKEDGKGKADMRWSVWRALARVELWQAVLLSLDIEPESRLRDELIRGPLPKYGRRFGRPLLPTDAFDRLSICKQALSYDHGPIRPQGPLYRGILSDSECHVLLAEVAAFLLSAAFTVPDEMRALLGDTLAPAETKQEREDRRLKACEDAGLNMSVSAVGRLPNGVGKVAEAEGMTRQAFSDAVKAALKRRQAAGREGR